MALNTVKNLGAGGTGYQGDGLDSAAAVLTELQGLKVELLAGALANTKIEVAAIREEDTILKALNNNAGVITDVTGTMSIVSVKASGTLTLDTVIAGSECEVNGKTYTFQATAPTKYGQVQVGLSDTASATNLAAAIEAYENSIDGYTDNGGPVVSASSDAAVVTVTAIADGTGGNAVTLVGDATITASGTGTLAGGTATGGVKSSGATDQLLLFWYNKR